MKLKNGAFLVYNIVLAMAAPFVLAIVMFRWRHRFIRGLRRSQQRWGRLSPETIARFPTGRRWWVHAVSVGEVKAIEHFLRRAPKEKPIGIVMTVVTPEAIKYAEEKKLADVILAAPLDLPWMVRRVAQAIRPELFVSVEAEFWPNLIREAKRSGARVALINGRLSERSFARYQKIKWLLPALWDCFDLVSVRESQDAERFAGLGVAPFKIHLTGNLKYDLLGGAPVHSADPASATLVIGSSREGEEAILLPVIKKLQVKCPGLTVVWAPRHLERMNEVEALLQRAGVAFDRKSAMTLNGRLSSSGVPHILWDTMGDLLEAYRRADLAVIGGSFVQKGGQNPIEPASLGLPVVFGPSMENFTGIEASLMDGGGARQVTLENLEKCLYQILTDKVVRESMGRRARATVDREQGATERTLELLDKVLHA